MGLLSSASKTPGIPANGEDPKASGASRGLFSKAKSYVGEELPIESHIKDSLGRLKDSTVAMDAIAAILQAFLPITAIQFLFFDEDSYVNLRLSGKRFSSTIVDDVISCETAAYKKLRPEDAGVFEDLLRCMASGGLDTYYAFRLASQAERPIAIARISDEASLNINVLQAITPQLANLVVKSYHRESKPKEGPFREKIATLLRVGGKATVFILDLYSLAPIAQGSNTSSCEDDGFEPALDVLKRSIKGGILLRCSMHKVCVAIPSIVDPELFMYQVKRSLSGMGMDARYASVHVSTVEEALQFFDKAR